MYKNRLIFVWNFWKKHYDQTEFQTKLTNFSALSQIFCLQSEIPVTETLRCKLVGVVSVSKVATVAFVLYGVSDKKIFNFLNYFSIFDFWWIFTYYWYNKVKLFNKSIIILMRQPALLGRNSLSYKIREAKNVKRQI